MTSESTMASTRAFWEAFQNAYDGEKTTAQEEERDPAVEKFLKDLRTKGATAFLADLNREKIEEKIKEFRDKLIKEMGDSPQSMIKIEELVSQFKKQLLEEMQANLDDDTDSQKLDAQAMIKIVLDMKSEEDTPFEKLLHVEV